MNPSKSDFHRDLGILLSQRNQLEDARFKLETALDLHGSIHREINKAKCILHVHSKYATIVSTFKKKRVKN